LTLPAPVASEQENKENGLMDIHAGFSETSRMMFVRPDLVYPVYKTLPVYKVDNPVELFQIAQPQNWQGYIGSPRLARTDFGAQDMNYSTELFNAVALAILDGRLDERTIGRYADFMLAIPPVAKALEGSTRNDAEIERKQREWMKKKGIE
jgi:hypothetical protein